MQFYVSRNEAKDLATKSFKFNLLGKFKPALQHRLKSIMNTEHNTTNAYIEARGGEVAQICSGDHDQHLLCFLGKAGAN